ncbi:MAG: hypothetical protein IH940_08110 [Acidobacteria bacterium]|nr:hypothetical protein [Acidobacteriota bacterium]
MRWLIAAAILIAASASVSGLGLSSDSSDSPAPPDSLSFDLVEPCEDYLDPQSWSDAVPATNETHGSAVSTRFSLAATACARQINAAADAAALGLGIDTTEAQERLLQVTQTE